MINITKEGVILEITNLEFENEGVLNPAVFQEDNTVHVFYRAVRSGNNSTIGYAKLDGPTTVVSRNKKPLIAPDFSYESQGVEDARIVKIDDLYYMTYTAYDGKNPVGAYATSKNLVDFEKHGIITGKIKLEEAIKLLKENGESNKMYVDFLSHQIEASEENREGLLPDKNLILFPRKINDKFVLLHRIKPAMQIIQVNDLADLTAAFWIENIKNLNESTFLAPVHEHESAYLGGGCPPIETAEGWLIIYHGVTKTVEGNIYNACAALFDIENPKKEIARLPYPLFSPEEIWERNGYVNNVVFPTGTATFDDRLYIYYGAADDCIAVASVNLPDLISELLAQKKV